MKHMPDMVVKCLFVLVRPVRQIDSMRQNGVVGISQDRGDAMTAFYGRPALP